MQGEHFGIYHHRAFPRFGHNAKSLVFICGRLSSPFANRPFLSHSLLQKVLPDLPSDLYFFGYWNNICFTEEFHLPCVQPPIWWTGSLYPCPQLQSDPVILPNIQFPFLLLRLAGIWWRNFNPPPHGKYVGDARFLSTLV
jgi:hypothetical protein